MMLIYFGINNKMPYSHPSHYTKIVNLILNSFDPKTSYIIDIGVGAGVYRNLLPNYNMDGIEIYRKYIDDFNLESRYNLIFNEDAVKFNYNTKYNLAIMGDVLEHLEISEAKLILNKLIENKISVIVQVPYLYEQGEYDGNTHEIHIQSDLTDKVFKERYSEYNFKLLSSDEVCGVYYSIV
jgi:hypothetical protein